MHGGDLDWTAPSPEAAVAEVLVRRGLACTAADVTWVDAPAGKLAGVRGALFGRSRALVRASEAGEPTDLYLVDGRRSPEGTVLWVGDARNLTNTSGVDESRPVLHGSLAAYTTSGEGLVTGVHVIDLEGRAAEPCDGCPPSADLEADFTLLQRVQAALTNLQQTGQTGGVAHTAFALDPVASRAEIAWRDDGTLEARVDEHVVVIDARRAVVSQGADFVRVVPEERARPGNAVTWAVDRVRAVPWFGDDRMQWLKAVAFTALDKVRATFSRGTTAEDVRDEIGLAGAGHAIAAAFTDPEVGWPPAPLKPAFARPLPGEGQWIALDRDPFITPTPDGAAPAFVTSFVRPDLQRSDVRVYVTLWDPRQVALHMEAGTVEPISATGEHGSGMIPRTPEVMEHVVAACNGGLPGPARRVRHAGRRHRVPAAQTVRRHGGRVPRRNQRLRRVAGGRAGAGRRSRHAPEPDGPGAEREVQPLGPDLVGRRSPRVAGPGPYGSQRRLPDAGGLRRVLL